MHSAIDAPGIEWGMAKSFGFANTTPFSATAVHDTVAENEAKQSWRHPINTNSTTTMASNLAVSTHELTQNIINSKLQGD